MIHAPEAQTEHPGPADGVRLACQAMASRFELVLHGDDPAYLRAAGEEALSEIQRIEAKLTRFHSTSDIGRINSRGADAPVRVDAQVFSLLSDCKSFSEETGGAFDITVGPLMQTWGFVHHTGRVPDAEALEEARRRTGMHLVELDPEDRTVRLLRPGVMLDLGAIGKGYAVDEAVAILRDAGVESAFLHGGTSTIAAIGTPPDHDAWQVAIPHPDAKGKSGEVIRTVPLKDATLSVSAVWGREFVADDVSYGHVIDPRRGRPVDAALLAAVEMPSATAADAISTALLVMGEEGQSLAPSHPEMRALVVMRHDEDFPRRPQIARLEPGVAVW